MRARLRSLASGLLSTSPRLAGPARREAVARPLGTGGFLGASIAGWVATSPSLLPRTWWMWAMNIGMSQVYGYAAGVVAEEVVKRGGGTLGVSVHITPDKRRRARLLGAAALTGISAYSWVRGVLRQREISHLVRLEPKNLATHVVGTAGGIGLSLSVLVAARAVIATGMIYRAVLRPYLPPRIVGVASVLLTVATVAFVAGQVVRRQILAGAIERGEAANRMFAMDVEQPMTPTRSGSPESHESWPSLGAQGRKIVAGGADGELISRVMGPDAMEPIRVYAGKSTSRTLEETVDAVIAELDRTGAWDREVLALFNGTGTGWLQEWSLSAIEFLTHGNCATASLQYSVYSSAVNYVVDRRTPQRAGRALFRGVRERLARMPADRRPRLFVAGESLGSFGGHAAFRDVHDMLDRVDGAVWTGTPRFTPIHRQLTENRREGSPEIAPVIDHGRHIRFVTHPRDLQQNFYGGLYTPWRRPRIVYAQHASDPVVWWSPSLLWKEPQWLRERAGRDVTPAMRWAPWITFWQIAADMPLSITMPGGHGHSYKEEMVPIWAAVLGRDPEEDHRPIIETIRAHAIKGDTAAGSKS